MATRDSKDLSYFMLNAHEEAVENPCSICLSQQQREVESTDFCVECDSNMCKGCTKLHANFPSMKSHKVVDILRASNARKTRVQLPTQRCEVHNNKIIESFCRDHGELACDSCVSHDHRKCDNLEYIPVFSKGIKTSQELLATKTSTKSVLKALKDYQVTQQATLQNLDTAELLCQQDLQDHKDNLHKRIDKLAKNDSAKITSKFQGERDVVTQSIKAVDDKIDTLETVIKGLKHSKGDNEPELFVYMKQGEKTEKESKQLLHAQQQSHKQIYKYKFHSNIEKALGDVKALGEFEEAVSLKPTILKPAKLKPASFNPASLKLRGDYTVRIASDKSECDITGACLLPDASLMITDWKNNNLKQLDSSYKVTRSLGMGAEPYDVCYTNSNEVAVTLPGEKSVQFVCVGTSLKKVRAFSVGCRCKGITFSNGQFFICCGDSLDFTSQNVQVFSLAGKPLRTIQYDPKGKPLFSNTRKITISSCGNTLYVTNGDKGVVITDRSGKFQQQFRDKELSNASGVCALDNGDILVGGLNSDNILHVSRDGKKLGVVLGKQDGLVEPQALVFYPIVPRIIVTTYKCDKIKVYEVQ